MATNLVTGRETLVSSPDRYPRGDTVSAVQPTLIHSKNGKVKQPKQATPHAVPPKPETEFRVSGSAELSPQPTQDAAAVPAERQPTKLISPEEFQKQHEAPFLGLLPKGFDRWAGLTEEARIGEWAAIWQKDQFAALTVIAPAMMGAKHMYEILQVYRPMILKFKDELRINGRPSKERAQRTWRSIGIDLPGVIGWESACKLMWNATPQYVNRCIRQGGRDTHRLTDGKPDGGGAAKRRGRKDDPKGSSAAPAQAIQTPRALLEAMDRNETFKDALENVFMVDSEADFVSRVKEFAQLLADSFRPRGHRVVVEVKLVKERKGTACAPPASRTSEDVKSSGPTPPAASGDPGNGALPAPDPKTSPQAGLEEPIPAGPGAEPLIPVAADGGLAKAVRADVGEPVFPGDWITFDSTCKYLGRFVGRKGKSKRVIVEFYDKPRKQWLPAPRLTDGVYRCLTLEEVREKFPGALEAWSLARPQNPTPEPARGSSSKMVSGGAAALPTGAPAGQASTVSPVEPRSAPGKPPGRGQEAAQAEQDAKPDSSRASGKGDAAPAPPLKPTVRQCEEAIARMLSDEPQSMFFIYSVEGELKGDPALSKASRQMLFQALGKLVKRGVVRRWQCGQDVAWHHPDYVYGNRVGLRNAEDLVPKAAD